MTCSSTCAFFITAIARCCQTFALRERSCLGVGAIWQSNIYPQSLAQFAHFSVLTLAFFSDRPRAAFFFHPPSLPVGTAAQEFLEVFTNVLNLSLLFHIERSLVRLALVVWELQNERFWYLSPSLVVVVERNIFREHNHVAKIDACSTEVCLHSPVLCEINVNC